MLITDETICAISTAPGMGAIATVRVAGPDAFSICDKCFRSPRGKRLQEQKGGTFAYGTFIDGETVVDEVVVSVFRAPHSFTGEDIAEITCHGSVVIQGRILKTLIANGCRMARPGEFTQRAFANGKMDLSQAEAVADLIASQSEAARRVALNQMRGGFSTKLSKLRQHLLQFISLLELELDFSEEDVEFADRTKLIALVGEIAAEVAKLMSSFSLGNAIKNGVPVAIVGKTNAGKSTLLNALVGEERAIVSNVHGTTRDTIEDVVNIHGIAFRFIDTAGLRRTDDEVESIGIDRTWSKLRTAQIVILLSDATANDEQQDRWREEVVEAIDTQRQHLIEVYNKRDLLSGEFAVPEGAMLISAHDARDVEALKERIASQIDYQAVEGEETIVTNMRHYEALSRSAEALKRVDEGLRSQLSGELVAMDIHDVLDALADITGEVSSQDVLNNIFAHFCIGK